MSKDHNDTLPLETIVSLLYDAENDLLDEIRAFASKEGFEVSKVNGKPNGFNVVCCKHPQDSKPVAHGDGDTYVCKNGVVKRYPQNKTQNKDCPWKIYISKTKKNGNKWKVTDTSFQALKEHSHELEPGATNIYASYRRRNRTGATQVAIIQDAQNGISPAQTLAHLGDNVTDIPSDIYNMKYRYRYQIRQERSPIEELAFFFETHGYTLRLRHHERTGVLKGIFAAHGRGIELALAFPEVIIIDATYKTNLNKLPLVNIVGVSNLLSTSTSDSLRTFYIASIVVVNEDYLSYTWILQCLADVIWRNETNIKPGLFVSDDDRALKSAFVEVFPEVPRILCAWHIARNFGTKINKAFGAESKEGAELKAKVIPQLLYTRSKSVYKDAVKKFEEMADRATNKEVDLKAYLNGMRGNEEMWAGPWAEKHAHFGARTSQRAEGTHAGIKHILKQPSLIVNLFEKLHIYLDAQDKSATFEYSREKGLNWIVHDPVAKQAISMLEKNNICHYAIRKTILEISEACKLDPSTVEESECDCEIRINYKLPCKHDLWKYLSGAVDHLIYDKRWTLVKSKARIPRDPVFDSIAGLIVDPEQSRINQQYDALRIRLDQMMSSCETSQQKADLLKSLDDVMDSFTPVQLQKFVLPSPVIPKGRPPKAIGLRNRSLCETTNEQEVVDQEKKRKREPKVGSIIDKSKQAIDKASKKAKKQIGNDKEDLFGTKNKRQPVPSNNGKGIPMEYVVQRVKIIGDGRCGYRSLAQLIYGDQNLYNKVKKEMLDYLRDNVYEVMNYYCLESVYDFAALYLRLEYETLNDKSTSQSSGLGPYPYQYWFHGATDALLAASTFQRPIVIYNECQDNSSYGFDDYLYLPHRMPLNKVGTLPAVMVFDQGASHYEALKMKTSTKIDWPSIYHLKKHQEAWEALKDKKGLGDYVATWTYLKKVKKAKAAEPLLARLLQMDIVEIADADNMETLDPDIANALETAIDEANESESEKSTEDKRRCPFCKEPLYDHNAPVVNYMIPKVIQRELDKLDALNKKFQEPQWEALRIRNQRNINLKKRPLEGVFLKMAMQDIFRDRPIGEIERQRFCRIHRRELVYKPMGEKHNYPATIDWEQVEERVTKLLPDIIKIIRGETRSIFKIIDFGMMAWFSTKMRAEAFSSFLETSNAYPHGYYGPKGKEEIMEILTSMLVSPRLTILSDSAASPRQPHTYIINILVPEVIMRLIQQDRNVDELTAIEVLVTSSTYGTYMFES